jgi:CHAD domain-containing protein
MDVVHDMRVAARRLRAALTLLGDDDLVSLEPEVKALQDALGAVRDGQVQSSWLRKAGPGAEDLAASVESGWREKSKRLENALRAWSSAVAPEMNQLVTEHAAWPGRLGDRRTGKPIRNRLTRVDKRIGRVLSDPSPRAVHGLRIDAKKLRYAAELVEPGYPKAAKALLMWLEPLLDKLGDLHDTDVRISMLKDADEKAQGILHDVERTRVVQVDGLLADLRKWPAEDLRQRFDRAFRQRKEAKRLAKAMKNGAQKDRKSQDKKSGDENKEIEQKFLVRPEAIAGQSGVEYRQAYLAATPQCSIRVRIANGDAHLTIKGKNQGVSRSEWEYPIPAEDAEVLLGLSPGPSSRRPAMK